MDQERGIIMKAIIHATLYDYQTFIQDGYILFNDKIIETGPMTAFHQTDEMTIIDGTGHLVLPNFARRKILLSLKIKEELVF